MAYKIRWDKNTTTAEAYSNKKLAKSIKGRRKGEIIPFKLGSETKSPLGYDIVWTEHNPFFSKTKGKVYTTRNPIALQKSEKIVKNWWKK